MMALLDAVVAVPLRFFRKPLFSPISAAGGLGSASEATKLQAEPAGQLSGFSGKLVDEQVLKPLGVSRKEAWIADCLHWYCSSVSGGKRIMDTYRPFAKQFGLPKCVLPAHPSESQVRVADHVTRVDANPNSVHVRELGNRWASCRRNGTLQFHWRVNQLPVPLIDYIIVHEHVHLHEPHHTPVFWGAGEESYARLPTAEG